MPWKEGDSECLCGLVDFFSRIYDYEDSEGSSQENFLLMIVEAVGSGRLALGTMTTWLCTYGARQWDNAHYLLGSQSLPYNLDGGMYGEGMEDLEYAVGQAGIAFLNCPRSSNMVRSGDTTRGRTDLGTWDHAKQREHIFIAGVLDARTLRPRGLILPLPHAGMSGPLVAPTKGARAVLGREAW